MPKVIDHDENVEFFIDGEWLPGVIYSVITHENEKGIVSRLAYQIQLDEKNMVEIDATLVRVASRKKPKSKNT